MTALRPFSVDGRNPIPALAGVGLRPEHYADILAAPAPLRWFEVHPENYMCAGGPQHRCLTQIRVQYPLSFHGVGLSLGGAGRPDAEHLDRLRVLIDRYQPALFSEHLAWSTHGGRFLNDLLPLSYTRQTLDRLTDHVDETQERLGRQILIENPSLYVQFSSTDMTETEFLRALADRTGCGLLLDINNAYVSSINFGRDPMSYLDAFPWQHVQEIHLAGHLTELDERGQVVLIDAHSSPVCESVWELYRRMIRQIGPIPTLIEWDQDMPAWPDLLAEAQSADRILQEYNRVIA